MGLSLSTKRIAGPQQAPLEADPRDRTAAHAAPRSARSGRHGVGLLLVLVAVLAYWLWLERQNARLPAGIAETAGVLTAMQSAVAAPLAGIIAELAVETGETVQPGSPVAVVKGDREIAVASTVAGRIDGIGVKEGEPVEAGRIIATVTEIGRFTVTAPIASLPPGGLPLGAEARLYAAEFGDRFVAARLIGVIPLEGGAALEVGRGATARLEVTDTRGFDLKPGQRVRIYVRAEEGVPWPTVVR